jgi:hypothetical protein
VATISTTLTLNATQFFAGLRTVNNAITAIPRQIAAVGAAFAGLTAAGHSWSASSRRCTKS